MTYASHKSTWQRSPVVLVLNLGPMKAASVLIGPVAGILENHLSELAKVMRSRWMGIVCSKWFEHRIFLSG